MRIVAKRLIGYGAPVPEARIARLAIDCCAIIGQRVIEIAGSAIGVAAVRPVEGIIGLELNALPNGSLPGRGELDAAVVGKSRSISVGKSKIRPLIINWLAFCRRWRRRSVSCRRPLRPAIFRRRRSLCRPPCQRRPTCRQSGQPNRLQGGGAWKMPNDRQPRYRQIADSSLAGGLFAAILDRATSWPPI